VKTKGIFEPVSVKKSPAFEIIYEAVMASFGITREGQCAPLDIADFIKQASDNIAQRPKFLAVRTVNGGAVIDPQFETRDDWVLVAEKTWKTPSGKKATRVSRPKPYEVFLGGTNVGRVVRWYVGNEGKNIYTPKGGRVPLTDNAVLVQDLKVLDAPDFDLGWYIARAEKLREAIQGVGEFESEEAD
jgi:hypothetical protein